MNEGCEAEPRVWRYHRWDSFTCAKMKAGIVVGCLLKVSAMASDDEGFALSVTSKLREFTALGYPAHVLNGVIGRAFARSDKVRTNGSYEQDNSGEQNPYPEAENPKRQTNVLCRATVQRRV